MSKTFFIAFIITLSITCSYYIGKYKGSRHEEFLKCQEELMDKIESRSLFALPELQNASFDVIYLYSLGWSYQCAFLKGY